MFMHVYCIYICFMETQFYVHYTSYLPCLPNSIHKYADDANHTCNPMVSIEYDHHYTICLTFI